MLPFKFFDDSSQMGHLGNAALSATKPGQALSLAQYMAQTYGNQDVPEHSVGMAGQPQPPAQTGGQAGQTDIIPPLNKLDPTQPIDITGIPNMLNNGGILGLVGKVAGFI